VLRDAIRAAVERQLPADESGFLMLSSGKDSSALALGLADAGRADFPCVTFVAGSGDSEPVHASKLCGRLGLRHETVGLQLAGSAVEDLLREFFAASPLPCGDFAQIPYVLCVRQAGPGISAVLDGSGNDAYMGYVPSRSEILKQRLCTGHGRLARALARGLGPQSGFNYFLRSPADATLPGRTFRAADSRAFHPGDVDTGPFWQALSDEWGQLDEFAFRNSPVERHVDQAEILLKLRLAASFAGQRPVLPFCDEDLIDYVFHLPEAARFHRRTRTNKLLLREVLARYADYDADAIGKGFFEFDGAGFLLQHRDFVLDEIGSCSLWDPRMRERVETWLRRLERRPLLYHCLLPLLMLSGWHNHSRFLERASSRASRVGGEAA
jgi:asparagine synthetase B (glutamine-hydrolysing)